MRVSRAQAEENRETVINVASRLFREHGFDGIGLKDLMKGAGLTQGGFYKQFASKDDLAAQASRRAMESATRRWSEAAADSSDPLEAVMAFYLSKDHRGEKAEGCPWWHWGRTLLGRVTKSGVHSRMGYALTSRCSMNCLMTPEAPIPAARRWRSCLSWSAPLPCRGSWKTRIRLKESSTQRRRKSGASQALIMRPEDRAR